MEKPETKFVRKVLKDLNQLPNCYCFKTQEVGRRGTPDIIGCLNGMFFALEAKVGRNVATELQLFVLGKMAHSGAFTSVVSPDVWSDVLEQLRAHSNKRGAK